MTTFSDLPDELLQEVFKKLTYTEKLISRLVCHKWNTDVSVSLDKIRTFMLKKESHQILVDTFTPWGNLHVPDIELVIPKSLKKNVNTLWLDVNNAKSFHRANYFKFILGFPNLTHLSLNFISPMLDTDKENANRSKDQYAYEDEALKDFSKKMESLELRCRSDELSALIQFLSVVEKADQLNLENFKIIIDGSDQNPNQGNFPFSEIYNIVSRSARTLKNLTCLLDSDLTSNEFILKVLDKLKTNKELKLSEIWLFNYFTADVPEPTFVAYQEFVRSQRNSLLEVTLLSTENPELSKLFLKNVPENIEAVAYLQNQQMFRNFKKLNSVTLVANTDSEMLSEQCPSVRSLWLELTTSNLIRGGDSSLLRNLSSTMPNLTELSLENERNNVVLCDQDLQLIIKDFNKLQVLEIYNGGDVTDAGVTGIEEEYLDELVKTRRIYLGGYGLSLETIPKEKITGAPISSLKKLGKLLIHDAMITDTGISLGFRFGSSLKNLEITFFSSDISDWGLHCLGANNSGLEKFSGIFSDELITPLGKEEFKNLLPLIQSTQQFKLSFE